MEHEPAVFVVDDDPAVLDALEELIDSVGLSVKSFSSAQAFLEAYDPDQPGCLILDIRMPGMDGLELQQRLKGEGIDIPIIFLSGHADVPIAVRAVQAGAFDFVEKPFREQSLLDSIKRAITLHQELRRRRSNRDMVLARLASLTDREREVLDLVIEGKTSKAIANELDRSHKTIDQHRAKILEKMQAENVASLVRMVLDVKPT
ncbi:MAG: response regulator transcription factor [Phycisphaerae bacterium]|nr:response regulator transcription factor [Phycisphaerae bacterium]